MKCDVYLAGSVRTPVGSFCKAFADFSAIELGKVASKAAIKRSGLTADQIDEVIMGNILSSGLRPNAARQIALGAGCPNSVPAVTVNMLCGSGMKAIIMAAQSIQSGDNDAVLVGGVENMSRAPYLLEQGRTGYRLGDGKARDSILRDALVDPFDDSHMGLCGDRAAERCGFSREEQDTYAIASYKRALAAIAEGKFKDEITPVEIKDRKGRITIFDTDEEPQRFDEEKFSALRPAFGKDGTVTAGNASSINDGAAALVVVSGTMLEKLKLNAEAKLVGYAQHSHEPEWFTLAPIDAVRKLMDRLNWSVEDVDLFEINEAFSVVPMAVMKELGIPHEKMNVHGGAVCIGHPVGASGARIVATLVNALKVYKKRRGIASLCIGGGQAVAIAIELV